MKSTSTDSKGVSDKAYNTNYLFRRYFSLSDMSNYQVSDLDMGNISSKV